MPKSQKLSAKLAKLPKEPGVYFHKDAGGEIIYIGKAANLKNRVGSYFQQSRQRDYKTELQEVAYRRFRAQPVYELVGAHGPDHAKRFTTRIRIQGRELGVGEGDRVLVDLVSAKVFLGDYAI